MNLRGIFLGGLFIFSISSMLNKIFSAPLAAKTKLEFSTQSKVSKKQI